MGFENFNYQILAEFFDKNSALEFEDAMIRENLKDPLKLNRCAAGPKFCYSNQGKPAPNRGKSPSDETRAKMSIARRRRVISEETKKRMSETLKNRSPEEKARASANQSAGMIGHIVSEETRKKIGDANRGRKVEGRPHTEESKKKIGDANRGKPGRVWTQEQRDSHGRIWTQEQKDKMVATAARNRLLKQQNLINTLE